MTPDARKTELERRLADLRRQTDASRTALATCVMGTQCPGGRHLYHDTGVIPHDVPHEAELRKLLGVADGAPWGGYFVQCLGCGRRFVQRGGSSREKAVGLPAHVASDVMWKD